MSFEACEKSIWMHSVPLPKGQHLGSCLCCYVVHIDMLLLGIFKESRAFQFQLFLLFLGGIQFLSS